jgi:hypothetical protein
MRREMQVAKISTGIAFLTNLFISGSFLTEENLLRSRYVIQMVHSSKSMLLVRNEKFYAGPRPALCFSLMRIMGFGIEEPKLL